MKTINGTIYGYSYLCWRKVWLFAHNITMEHLSEFVAIGKQIDESSYSREKKHLMVDGAICIDFLKNGIIYEIKKSSKNKEMAINQIKFYLYTLLQKGIPEPEGVLCIPEERERLQVLLNDNDVVEIRLRMVEIEIVISSDDIPNANRIKSCNNCSYHDLCFI